MQDTLYAMFKWTKILGALIKMLAHWIYNIIIIIIIICAEQSALLVCSGFAQSYMQLQ